MGKDLYGIVGTQQAGSFDIEAVVGEVPGGVLYRAMHGVFNAPVSVRCLSIPRLLAPTQRKKFIEAFREQAQTCFRLSQSIQEIVRPLHVGVIERPRGSTVPVPFVAFEWADGQTLAEVIDKRIAEGKPPLPTDRLLDLLFPIAKALHRSHRVKDGPIIVGDVRPQSIVIRDDADGQLVKLSEFGFGRAWAEAQLAAGAKVSGPAAEPAYAAPEQWRPERFGDLSPATDVWGLALTMVEALTGWPPIEGDQTKMMSVALDDRRRPTPRTRGSKVSKEIDEVFARALAVDPAKRTASIAAFWDELADALGSLLPSLDEAETGARHALHSEPAPAFSELGLGKLPPAAVGPRAKASGAMAAVPARKPPPPPVARKPALGVNIADAARRSSIPAPNDDGHDLGPVPPVPDLELDLPPSSAGPKEDDLLAALPPALEEEPEVPPVLADLPPPSGGLFAATPPTPDELQAAAKVHVGGGLFDNEPSEPKPAVAPPEEADIGDDAGADLPIDLASQPAIGRPAPESPPSVVEPALPAPAASAPVDGGSPQSPMALGLGNQEPIVRRPALPPSRPPVAAAAVDPSDLKERLRLPAILIGIAVFATLLDVLVARVTGDVLPISMKWVSMPLALAGVGLGIWRFIQAQAEA